MIAASTEILASAYDPNLGEAKVTKKNWESFAGLPDRLRVVPWYKVLAATDTTKTPVYYSSSEVAGLDGMIVAPSPIPTTGEVGAPLVKTETGVEFSRLRLLE